jgi:TonB family protein
VGPGDVDQAKLDSFVRARIGGLRACYETQLKLDQRRDGTVRMRFAILSTGELSDVAVAQDTLDAPAMADCLIRIVRTWKTPFRPAEPVSVEYPFVFRPSHE